MVISDVLRVPSHFRVAANSRRIAISQQTTFRGQNRKLTRGRPERLLTIPPSRHRMEANMIRTLGRRDFLVGSAAVAGAAVAGGFACVEFASAAPIEVPVVDELSIKVLVDSTHNLF